MQQTHITVRRFVGRRHVNTKYRATNPHAINLRRRELIKSAATTAALLLASVACAMYLSLHPLH